MKRVAPLRYGVIFKKAFCHPEVFKAFVRDLLGVELEIDHVETEKSFKPAIGPVDSRFDLFAEDKKNRIVVDIQHVRLSDHYDRFLYYHCAAMLELTAHSDTYRSEMKVFTIVVLTSGDRHRKDVVTIDFDPKDFDGQGIDEIPHQVMYVCPKYANEKTPAKIRDWLEAIDDTLDQEVDESKYRMEIRHVFDLIEEDHVSPQDRAQMKDEAAYEEKIRREYEKKIVQSKKEKAQEIAINMMKENFKPEQIAKMTGLSLDQIHKLEKTNNSSN